MSAGRPELSDESVWPTTAASSASEPLIAFRTCGADFHPGTISEGGSKWNTWPCACTPASVRPLPATYTRPPKRFDRRACGPHAISDGAHRVSGLVLAPHLKNILDAGACGLCLPPSVLRPIIRHESTEAARPRSSTVIRETRGSERLRRHAIEQSGGDPNVVSGIVGGARDQRPFTPTV